MKISTLFSVNWSCFYKCALSCQCCEIWLCCDWEWEGGGTWRLAHVKEFSFPKDICSISDFATFLHFSHCVLAIGTNPATCVSQEVHVLVYRQQLRCKPVDGNCKKHIRLSISSVTSIFGLPFHFFCKQTNSAFHYFCLHHFKHNCFPSVWKLVLLFQCCRQLTVELGLLWLRSLSSLWSLKGSWWGNYVFVVRVSSR